jgi:hypothetical protein
MERALELREKAARCLRLSKCVSSPADVAYLEALAAEAINDAEQREAYMLANREAEQEPDTLTDRHRPGRRDDVSPRLIPLLRENLSNSLNDEPDQLRASRGIITWAVISAVVFAVIVVVFRMSL